MRVLLIGATGGTGLALLSSALAAGHSLTVLARTPSKLPHDAASRCTVIVGDAVKDKAAVASAVRGQEAILLCLGSRGIMTRSYDCSEGTRTLLEAVKAGGEAPPRIVVCSSMGVAESGPWIAGFVGWMLKHPLADKAVQEADVKASGAPFVLVRPTGLNDAAPRGADAVAAVVGGPLPTSQISRADVAQFMVAQLADTPYLGKAVGISWKK
jgi:uncharacterized protein YbjT (DUF2867 family)